MDEEQFKNQFMFFEDRVDKHFQEKLPLLHDYKWSYFWSERVFVAKVESNDEHYWNYIAYDLLMNEERPIRFRKSVNFYTSESVYPLTNNFGLIVEGTANAFCVNLVRVDWETAEFHAIEKFMRHETFGFWVLIDKLDPQKFALCWAEDQQRVFIHRPCKLSQQGKIEVVEEFRSGNLFDFYSQDKLIDFLKYRPYIQIYDLKTKKLEDVKIDGMPKNGRFQGVTRSEWINQRLYVNVWFSISQTHQIMWADLETKKWNFANFPGITCFCNLKLFDNRNLIFYTHEKNHTRESKLEFFNIPMRRSHYLRKMAWILVVKIMKKREEEDPYKSAKEFLPLNSDLRAIWFKNEETKNEDVPVKKLKPN